jgi:hypothetical protein
VTAVYTFIAEEQADPECDWSICEMCRVLEVSRSGSYDWQNRGPSQRELDDAALAREIELIYIASGETYGVPRMTAWLVKQGFDGVPVGDARARTGGRHLRRRNDRPLRARPDAARPPMPSASTPTSPRW